MSVAAELAHRTLSNLSSDMQSSPVDGCCVISEQELQIIRAYILLLEKKK